MFYVPATESYYRLSPTSVPVHRTITDDSNSKLAQVQKELTELRKELKDLRLEKDSCRLCSASRQAFQSDETCRLCSPVVYRRTFEHDDTCSTCYGRSYSRSREENYSRRSLSASPVHYCSICQDYVIDQPYPPPSPSSFSPSRSSYRKKPKKKADRNDQLPEYLSRQIDLQGLHPRYIPEEKPVWIPTGYKHDYPHRRYATRQAHFSEP